MKILGLVFSFLFAVSAQAALTVDSNGILLGATGIQLNGNSYTVEFKNDSCANIWGSCDANGSFTWSSFAEAEAAHNALLNEVFVGIYDTAPDQTFGCTSTAVCVAITPYRGATGDPNAVSAILTRNFASAAGDDLATRDPLNPFTTTVNETVANFAQWTLETTPVPVPGALGLFSCALVGLGLRKLKAA